MPEDFESYKRELDRVRLTEESKQALTESLARRKQNAKIRPLGLRRIAAIAAVLCLLAGTAVAAEIVNRVKVDLVDPDESGVSAEGYSLRVKFSPIPLERLSEEALERFAYGEGDGIYRYEEPDGVTWISASWAEAEAFLGLDVGRNPLLERYPAIVGKVKADDTVEGTCWVGGYVVDDEGTVIPAGFSLISGYQVEDCLVQVMAELQVDRPAAIAFQGGRAGVEHGAFQYVDAGTVEGCYTTEDKQFTAEEYTTASGLTAIIVSRSAAQDYEPDDPDDSEEFLPYSTAYFVRDNAWFSIECAGPDHAREISLLKEVLDAYE